MCSCHWKICTKWLEKCTHCVYDLDVRYFDMSFHYFLGDRLIRQFCQVLVYLSPWETFDIEKYTKLHSLLVSRADDSGKAFQSIFSHFCIEFGYRSAKESWGVRMRTGKMFTLLWCLQLESMIDQGYGAIEMNVETWTLQYLLAIKQLSTGLVQLVRNFVLPHCTPFENLIYNWWQTIKVFFKSSVMVLWASGESNCSSLLKFILQVYSCTDMV